MSKLIDLTGNIFNRLTVISFSYRSESRTYFWNCRCECGKELIVSGSHLKANHTRSCGCYRDERIKESKTLHGEAKKGNITKEYRAWVKIKGRCYLPTDHAYKNYGGRGIKMCSRWFNSYDDFLADMGRAPTKYHSVDRKDNNGNYEPSNCRWATVLEQANNKRNNTAIEYNGLIKTIPQWSREFGLSSKIISKRLKSGWTTHEALRMPLLKGGPSIKYYRRIGRVPPPQEQES